MEMVKAVLSPLLCVLGERGRSNCAILSCGRARQIRPRPKRAMKAMSFGVTFWAETIKSPSFSRFSSSTTIIISPLDSALMRSCVEEMGARGAFMFLGILSWRVRILLTYPLLG